MLAPALQQATADKSDFFPVCVSRLTVLYGDNPALQDVTWRPEAPGLIAIVGPNGAGKSTLLKAILGLVPIHSGEVLIQGQPSHHGRGRIAYVPQRSTVDWDFPATALDVVTMGLYRQIGWLRPVRRRHREEARRKLAEVGLLDLADRQIGALSGGQQQRVFIARALAQNTAIYFLDEPFAGVDATTEKIIVEVFRKLRAQGKLVVCVHHDLASVPDIFDSVLLLNRTVICAGSISEAFKPALLARTYGVPINSDAL